MPINDYQPGTVLDLVRSGHLDTAQCFCNLFYQS